MVPVDSSLADGNQTFLWIPQGVWEISKAKIGVAASPALSNLYLDFID
jgi:hypothetical protein